MVKNFHYTICTQPDEELFCKQCIAIEKRFPNIPRDDWLEDVDGSSYKTYYHPKGMIRVCNDCNSGCLYVDSDFDLIPYFQTGGSKDD